MWSAKWWSYHSSLNVLKALNICVAKFFQSGLDITMLYYHNPLKPPGSLMSVLQVPGVVFTNLKTYGI